MLGHWIQSDCQDDPSTCVYKERSSSQRQQMTLVSRCSQVPPLQVLEVISGGQPNIQILSQVQNHRMNFSHSFSKYAIPGWSQCCLSNRGMHLATAWKSAGHDQAWSRSKAWRDMYKSFAGLESKCFVHLFRAFWNIHCKWWVTSILCVKEILSKISSGIIQESSLFYPFL